LDQSFGVSLAVGADGPTLPEVPWVGIAEAATWAAFWEARLTPREAPRASANSMEDRVGVFYDSPA
jgi:hypothetical protein